jgi:hypothetical protein
MYLDNPNLAVIPDFISVEHEEARQHLVQGGLSEEQAVQSLDPKAVMTKDENLSLRCKLITGFTHHTLSCYTM